MNKELNNEQLFDDIFKQSLENASSQVPPGVWEGVSSSIGAGAAASTTAVAVKAALWVKAAIAAAVIGTVAVVTYQLSDNKPSENVKVEETKSGIQTPELKNQVIENTPSSAITQTEPTIDTEKATNNKALPSAKGLKSNEMPTGTVSKFDKNDHYYSIDANLENLPDMDHLNQVKNQQTQNAPVDKIESKANPTDVSNKKTASEPVSTVIDSTFVEFPNAVTPNGDGINDVYTIKMVGEEYVLIQIFDVSYNKLYETTNKYKGWNCTLPNGELAPEGVYIVKVQYKLKGHERDEETIRLRLIK
ncbi:MAG TPA: gliding motility-associated C-terminal domain-containing protein [Bacteroidia bacterium]